MLRKLVKYEFKATSRLLVPLYLALLCLSIINHFTFKYGATEGVFAAITGILFLVQSLFMVGIVAATGILMIIRFYKNLLSDEGYLMFTLPVSTHQLILSKLIITLFWLIVGSIGALFSWLIVIGSFNDISLMIFAKDTMLEILAELNATFGFRWIITLIEFLVLGLLYLIGAILLVYLSIAIGQLFKKHKIIASFITYVVINVLLQIMAVIGLLNLGHIFQDRLILIDRMPKLVLPGGIIIGFIICSIFYMATHYIFTKKLNLA